MLTKTSDLYSIYLKHFSYFKITLPEHMSYCSFQLKYNLLNVFINLTIVMFKNICLNSPLLQFQIHEGSCIFFLLLWKFCKV